MFLALLLFKFIVGSAFGAASWSPQDRHLYQERKFIELEQNLLFKKQSHRGALVSSQRKDLPGCKDLKEGHGREQSFIKCLRFLNREEDLGIYSYKRQVLIGDMNLICRRFSEKMSFVQKILDQPRVFKSKKPWQICHEALWKQIYLTTSANFRADPVGMMSLARRAEENWGPDKRWYGKIQHLLVQN